MSDLTAESPAPLVEVVELYTRDGLIPAPALKAAILQLWRSETFAFRADGRLVAVIGFWPLDEHRLEMWFQSSPALRDHLVTLCRIARLTLSRVAETSSLEIVAGVRRGYRPGARMLRLIGFGPSRDALGAGLDLWRWQGGGSE